MAAEQPPATEAAPREPIRWLFFALWPDVAMAQVTRKAVRARRGLPTPAVAAGRPVAAANLHVKLAFLGSVARRRLRSSSRWLEGPRKRWTGLSRVRTRQETFSSFRLRDLVGRDFAPDLKPFRPHVTVARKVSRPRRIEKMHPIVWSFTERALVESRTLPTGALYSVVESHPLCGGKPANNSETA